jgi:hypothetical protein
LPSVGSPLPSVGSPYNPSTPEQTNILEVEEPVIVLKPTPASADIVKTITL